MIDYRHNSRAGVNPFAAAANVSPATIWTLGVPGALGPSQASSEGYTAILTEVAESPWTEDDAGVAIDVDNVWAVRTRAWMAGGGGEVDWWTMVPRVLPVGYTARGRSHVVPHIYDHLGDYPFLGVVEDDGFGGYTDRPVRWRTATGQYPSDLNGDGYLWTPMNLNQEVIDIPIQSGSFGFSEAGNSGIASGFTGPGCSIPVTAGPTLTRNWNYVSVGRHVGFRGGKFVLYLYDNATCLPFNSGTTRVVIGHSTTSPATNALPPDIVFDEEYEFSDLTNIGSGGGYNWRFELEVSLPAMPAPLGETRYWIVFAGACQAGSGNFLIKDMALSPRHDVPLWYWSSTRNRVAPGGIVIP